MLLVMENKKESIFDVLKDLIPLFTVEIVFLTAMNFANLTVVYRYLAIFLMIISFVQIIRFLPKNKTIIPLCVQIGLLLLFEITSNIFGFNSIFNTSVKPDLFTSIITVIALILGASGFYIIGGYYGIFSKEKLDFTKVIGAFYAGVGIYVLICTIITIYGMGTPFHTIIFANPNIENAWAYTSLATKARILIGFNSVLQDNGVAILGNMALLASTGLLAIFFVNRKQNPILFFGLLIGGIGGLITIVFLPIIYAALIFILALIFVGIIKLNIKHKKIAIITFFSIIAILFIGYTLFRFDSHNNPGKYNDLNFIIKMFLFPNLGIFNKLSGTLLLLKNFPAIVGAKFTDNIFVSSGTFIFNVAYQDGLLPMIAISAFFIVSALEIYKFCKYSKDDSLKIIVVALPLMYLINILINDVGFKMGEDFMFLGILMILGYVTFFNLNNKNLLENKNS